MRRAEGTTRRTASRPQRARFVVCLLAALACDVPTLAAARSARQKDTRRVAAAPARPDRALYQDAQRQRAALLTSRRLQARSSEWEKVALAFRRVVARYPQSPYCDNALLAVGDLYRTMAQRFKSARARADAIDAYRLLVAEYPSSSLGEQALAAVVEIERGRADHKRLAEAGSAYLAAFPDGPRAAQIKDLVRQRAPERAASLPSAPPPGLAQVFNLRFWSGAASTRVVVDVEKQVRIRYDRIANPDRLWIDLQEARLHPNLEDRQFPVGDGLLEKIRVGQNQDNVVRVVLDFKEVERHSVFYLQNPPRLVIDVQGSAPPQLASAEPAPPLVPARESAPPTATQPPAEPTPPPAPTPSPAAPAAPDVLATRRVSAATPRPDQTPWPTPAPRRTSVEVELPPPARPTVKPSASPTPTPPARVALARPTPAPPGPTAAPPRSPEPQPNRNGSISLARQLGLGARRIVVDAGHGGHDPGTIGRGGLQEKELVLDVALRVAALLRAEAGADVLMTRDSDVFIPLEERTAIANSKGADLFLSIHANSSRNAQARGIETYFLNFARNAHAEGVAARENAISAATLKDLQGLVKAIALNSKIDESRDFAASVQESLVRNLRAHYGRDVVDRGVHTAPFYVLIGANMPSILAEIAFVSHPEEERRLRTPEYRERIARSLFEGVRTYLEALNRARPRQLTRAQPRVVPARRGARR